MTPNELLLWLSARKQGSWPQFRSAIENLDLAEDAVESSEDAGLPLHQRVRYNLERLGHVEFDAAECGDGWRIVPPVLALSKHDNKAVGILCGARTRRLLEAIEKAATGCLFERLPHAACPDVIRIQADRAEALADFAKQQGILCQLDAPAALLSRLAPADSLKALRREPLPSSGKDWEVKRFTIENKKMRWQTATVPEANAAGAEGLFRFTRFQTPQYFLREHGETIRVPGALGKYYVLFRRRRHVLRFDRKRESLSLPAIFRPPMLTERALVLCSGFPPSLDVMHRRPRLTYRDIPEEIAATAAEVLKQDLS